MIVVRALRKALIILLAVILLVVAGFWFYCRVINHRSFMAGFTDLFLTVQHRSDKFTYLDSCEAYIAEKAEANKEPVVIEKAKFGISIREERLDALQAFIYNDQEHPAQTVFYFHGGAYINQPNAQQTTMAARTAKETGCEVVLMVYPKEPVYDCETAYEQCLSYYRNYLENKDCGKIVFMGDSAGGGLALGLAEVLRDEGDPCPEELILISPWVDVNMSNSEMADYVELDPMLGIDGLRRMGEDHRPFSSDVFLLLTSGTFFLCHAHSSGSGSPSRNSRQNLSFRLKRYGSGRRGRIRCAGNQPVLSHFLLFHTGP